MFKEIDLIVNKLKPESYVLYYDPSTMDFVTRWNGDWVDCKENRTHAPLVLYRQDPNLLIRNSDLDRLSYCNGIQVISSEEAKKTNLNDKISYEVEQGKNVHWLAYHPLRGFSIPLSDTKKAYKEPADTFTYDYQGTDLIGLVFTRKKEDFLPWRLY